MPLPHTGGGATHLLPVHVSFVAQTWHVPPAGPQAAVVLPGSHVLFRQHPVGHDAESHTHLPPEHTCPLPQAVAPPQVQLPVAEQPSPVVPQLVQLPPPVPHAIDEGVVQVLFWQQPVGHEVASQTHLPPEHSCPVAHAVAPPQVQVPLVEQPSAVAPQLVHEAPAVPQVAEDVGVLHVLPEQHPLGQLVALQPLHAPLPQVWPVGHVAHVAPAAPHALGSVPGWQVLPWQHPVEQEVASQMHAPPEQT
jgi:hypothetical protein